MHLMADIRRAELELGWKPEHNLAHAIWQLARESFPDLRLREPRERP
jgi:nucleoside-diphosphate-sugar epimerase